MISDNTCDAPLLGSKMDDGTEWSDEICALIHGPVTGVRIWESDPNGYIKLWVSNDGFISWDGMDI